MKIKLEKKYFQYMIYLFILISALIFVYHMFDSIGAVFIKIGEVLKFLMRLLMPFVFGFALAYLFNPLIMWFEKNIFNKKKTSPKSHIRRRMASIWLVYIIIFGLISVVFTYIIPKVIKSTGDLINRMPDYIWQASKFIDESIKNHQLLSMISIIENFDNLLLELINKYDLQNADFQNILRYVGRGVASVTTLIINLVLGFIIAYYLMMSKEDFIKETKRTIRAIMGQKSYKFIIQASREINIIFSKFIIGRSLDSTIVGLICFVGLIILNVPYSLLLSVIVGITNMIPYFGPFIGAVPAIIITLFDDPLKALWVSIFLFALQQFDSIVLGPKILGESLKINPVWIIFGVIVGGGFFGITGMILGVPIVASIRLFIVRYINKRIKNRRYKTKSNM